MKKNIIYLLFIIILITGCGKDNTKVNNLSDKERATIAAKNYIKEKYGFDLQDNNITNVIVDKNYDYTGATPTGYAEVQATYNGKFFKINLNYHNKDTNKYYDDYEKDIILKAIKDYYYPIFKITEENSITYIPEYIIYDYHTHDRFINLEDFSNKLKKTYDNTIYIITSDNITDYSKVNNNRNITLNLYKMENNADLSSYNKNHFLAKTGNKNTFNFKEITGKDDLNVKEKYYCIGTCNKTEYKITSLENNFYIKSIIPNEFNTEYEINIKKLNIKNEKKIIDQIKECGDNLEILNIYELSAIKNKYTNNPLTMYYYYNENHNSNLKMHIIDNSISCDTFNLNSKLFQSTTNFHLINNLKNYIIITE